MTDVRAIVSAVFLIAGFLLMTVSAIGVLRLPDFYTRLHASSIGETLGIIMAGVGLIIYHGLNPTSLKILLIIITLFLANPVGTHLIGKAALRSGKEPWKPWTDTEKEDEHADISH